jgi:DNA-binding CsgD family transcriptional regulator
VISYQRMHTLERPELLEYQPSRYQQNGYQQNELPLDNGDASVYMYALRQGSIDIRPDVAADLGLDTATLDEAVERLVQMRLLRAQPGDAHRWTPLDPDVAAASLISPLEAEIHSRRDMITSIREQMSTLLPRYEEAQHGKESPSYIRALRDGTEARGCLHRAADACRSEVISVRPRNVAWDAVMDEALVRKLSTLHRGVRVRVLYQHSARADLATRAHIRRIVADGAEVRTTNHLSRPFVVFDRETAFTPESWGTLEVSNTLLARLLGDVFEDIWSSALPYSAVEAGYQGAVDEIQKNIAKLLSEGLTDEVIARRVGLSLRACRRHIATLLRSLNAVSRFQAGIRAAKAGLVVVE